MSKTNPSQLFLLSDHIKLSLLERQRAISLKLSPNSQDGQISRSLNSLQEGIEALESQISSSDDPSPDLVDQTNRLRTQLTDLHAQFSSPSGSIPKARRGSLTTPNDPSLAADFSAAQTRPSRSPAQKRSVRFTDASPPDTNRAQLFPYRDNPEEEEEDGAPASKRQGELDNVQIHAYHKRVLEEQDAQLDQLGESIGRQRELSIRIGDELDDQAILLEDVEEGVDRHQGQLDRAGKRLKGVARKAKDNWSLVTIVVLIIILVLLIVITK